MGLREVVLSGSVLLLWCVGLCVASEHWFNLTTALERTPQGEEEGVTGEHQSNRTGQGERSRSPVSYRLRSLQLKSPARPLEEQMQTLRLTPEQLEPRETELLKGPDLNPHVKQEPKVLVKVEQQGPVQADSVAARCGEGEVTVEVKQNFLGNGQLIRPTDLTLGGCGALDAADHVLRFQTELQDCGSTATMTKDAIIYSFSLIYSPTPIGSTYILKTNQAQVVIECHYQRRHFVSSGALRPTWKQFSSNVPAEQQLHFSLRLMTEDWQSPRSSNVYFLGDVMRIEAAVLQGHHVPLRVYVDSCVATADPDPDSQPRYPFINNHGCFADPKLTAGAKSYFMPRSQEDKLHFLLKAFRFHQDHRNSLYITCNLKATTLSVPVDSQHKACSFLTEANRWVASGGDNKVCSCCESSCSERRRKRSLAADAGLLPHLQWEATAALGPVLLQENVLPEEAAEVPEPPPWLQTRQPIQSASPSVALLCGLGAALAVVLLVLLGAATCRRLGKPTAHAVYI